jgi:hypothetical protein
MGERPTREEMRERVWQLTSPDDPINALRLMELGDFDMMALSSLRTCISALKGEPVENTDHPHWVAGNPIKRSLEAESLSVFAEQMADRIVDKAVALRDCRCTDCQIQAAPLN